MAKNINTLGVLGLGNRATLFYLNALNIAFNNIEKNYSTFPFILYNTNFNHINPYLPNQFEKLLPALTKYLNEIEKLPITHLLIPNITLHEAIDKLEIKSTIIHPLQLSVAHLTEINKKQVVVFGSKYTMTSKYFPNYFSSEGIQILSPTIDDMEFIDSLRQKIYLNSETSNHLKVYNKLLSKYSKKAPVLIACTELSIIKNSIPVLDMVELQIQEAIKKFKID